MTQSTKVKTIAYFCAEYALEEGVSAYAGGLGVLAGEMLAEMGRREDIRFHAFGLLVHGGQKPAENGFELLPEVVEIPLENRRLKIQCWKKKYGSAALYFLDTDVEGNAAEDKGLGATLYDPDPRRRIYQDMILGLGGVALLRKWGIMPDIFHCNEGHTGFAALAALVTQGQGRHYQKTIEDMRGNIVATKHTILSASDTYISREDFGTVLGPYIRANGYEPAEIFPLGALDARPNSTAELFSMTKFLLTVAGRANGVSEAHVQAEKARFPQSTLMAITNGVTPERWQAAVFRQADWQNDDAALSTLKTILRSQLVDYANNATGSKLVNDRLTLVWARRFTSYKRPGLLLNDPEKLLALVSHPQNPIQIIVSGEFHPSDSEGRKVFEQWRDIIADPRFAGKIAYLPQYSLKRAHMLAPGADIWLNTPLPGFEACGTSGMKAGLNGAILVSTNDGWVAEVSEMNDIGFVLGEEDIEKNIYALLGEKVAPLFSTAEWVSRIRRTIQLIENRFTISRMVDDYVKKLY